MFGFIVALVSGALMSIQGVFNTEVTKQNRNMADQFFCAVYRISSLPCYLVF